LGGIKFTSGVTLKPIQLGAITFNTHENLYYLIMPCAVIMTFFARNLLRSRLGRAFVAIRDNDLAAEIMGISLFHYKLKAFFIVASSRLRLEGFSLAFLVPSILHLCGSLDLTNTI